MLERKEELQLISISKDPSDPQSIESVKLLLAHYELWISRETARMIRSYPTAKLDRGDFRQIAIMALIEAIYKFDESKSNGGRLGTLASWQLKALLDEEPLTKEFTGYSNIYRRVIAVLRTDKVLRLKSLSKFTEEDFAKIAEAIGSSLHAVQTVIQQIAVSGSMLSVDQQIETAEGPVSLADILMDVRTAEDDLIKDNTEKACKAILEEAFELAVEKRALRNSKSRELYVSIFRNRIIADETERASLRTIGDKFEISGERVRQIEFRLTEEIELNVRRKFRACPV